MSETVSTTFKGKHSKATFTVRGKGASEKAKLLLDMLKKADESGDHKPSEQKGASDDGK